MATTTTQTGQTGTIPLDPQVVALSKAILQTESGGDFTAKGASGEYGVAQWEPDTWATQAKQVLGYVPAFGSAEMTPQIQKAVLYSTLASDKKSGLNPAQIAAKWNSGSPDGWENKIGVNSKGVAYNVPQYVKSVTDAYQQLKQGNTNPTITPNASSVQPSQPTTAPASPYTGALGTNPNDSIYGKLIDNSITRGIQDIFPGKEVGQAIGTLGGLATTAAGEAVGAIPKGTTANYDTSAPTPLQTIADTAQGALMLGTGLPEGEALTAFGKIAPALPEAESVLGKIGMNAALGAGYGLTGAVANGSTNVGDIAKQTAFGATLGGVGGAVGEAVSKLADTLPSRIINNLLPQLKNPETVEYALNNVKLGTVGSMLDKSDASLQSYGDSIQSILNHPDNAAVKIAGQDILKKTLSQFPDSEYTNDSIIAKLKSQIPAQAANITKLSEGELTLPQANKLRQALDKAAYKLTIDSPEVKAGKDIAEAAGHALRTAVKKAAPDTIPLFDSYSKEINLNKALQKLELKSNKASLVNLKDLASIGIGTLSGGPGGALTGYAMDRIAASPFTKVASAKAINALNPVIQGATTIGQRASAIAGKTVVK